MFGKAIDKALLSPGQPLLVICRLGGGGGLIRVAGITPFIANYLVVPDPTSATFCTRRTSPTGLASFRIDPDGTFEYACHMRPPSLRSFCLTLYLIERKSR